MGYGWFEIVSTLLNLLLGGGLIVTFVTLKAQRQQAQATAKQYEANAESTEIDNLEKAARIWRESLEAREKYYTDLLNETNGELKLMRDRITDMESTIKQLTSTNRQILKILKDINHENLEQKKEEAKSLAGN